MATPRRAPAPGAYPAPSGPDLGRRDPDFIRQVLPVFRFLRDRYFRATFEGTDNLPADGRFIAVANHNGGPVLPDTWVMLSYWWDHFGPDRPGYALVHDAALNLPGLSELLWKVGAVPASRQSAEKVIAAKASLLIYPGGERDCLKSFWQRNVIDFHGRTSFVELALTHGVPILPVVNVGGHEVYFTLWSSERLARWTGIAQLTRVKTLPLQVGLPWGVWWSGFLPYLPLPAKFTYRVGEPIAVPHDPDMARNPRAVRRLYAKVTRVMQSMLDDLASRRTLPVFG